MVIRINEDVEYGDIIQGKKITYYETGGNYYFTTYKIYADDEYIGNLEDHWCDVNGEYYVAWISKGKNWETKNFDTDEEAIKWMLDSQTTNESLKRRNKTVRSLVRENLDDSIEIAFITPNLDVANAITDKARELGGFGSTWSETRWAYVDTPDTQDVNKIDKLIDFAQNNGAYINAPTAKKLTAKYGFRFD